MSDFFEIDPLTGIRSDFKWSENDQQYTINRYQDVEPIMDAAKAKANQVGLNRAAIKEGWWMYARLPPVVILQMRAKGINVFKKEDQARMFAEINSNYPYLKATTGNEGGREKIIVT